MKYEYLPIEQAKEGDIVEYCGENDLQRSKYINESRLHLVSDEEVSGNNLGVIDKSGRNVWDIIHASKTLWKLIKTKPGTEAKVGDIVVWVDRENPELVGTTYAVTELYSKQLKVFPEIKDKSAPHKSRFKVLCQTKEKRTEFINCKIKVTPDTRKAIDGKLEEYGLKEYGLINMSGKIDGDGLGDEDIYGYFIKNTHTGYTGMNESSRSFFKNHQYREIYWVNGDFSFEKQLEEHDDRLDILKYHLYMTKAIQSQSSTQNKQNTKETEMKETKQPTDTRLSVADIFNEAFKEPTDFESRTKITLVSYNPKGELIEAIFPQTEKEAKQIMSDILQSQPYGTTVTWHEEISAKKRKPAKLVDA